MIKKLGPLQNVLGMIPGMPKIPDSVDGEKSLRRVEAMIRSMTPEERTRPSVLNARRRQRIARGSGTSVSELNELMHRFEEMKKMMQRLTRGGRPDQMLKNLMGRRNRQRRKNKDYGSDHPTPGATARKTVPYYRIVVADKHSPRDGKFLELIGTYDPKKKGDNSTIKLERADHWIKNGALPSDTVRSILKKARAKSAKADAEVENRRGLVRLIRPIRLFFKPVTETTCTLMKHFLEYVVRSLVDNPDDVQVSEVAGAGETSYRIGLHPEDVGLVIGKGGRTISAIRNVINGANKTGATWPWRSSRIRDPLLDGINGIRLRFTEYGRVEG